MGFVSSICGAARLTFGSFQDSSSSWNIPYGPIRKNLVLRDADGYSPGRTKSAWSFRQEDARRPAITVLIGGLPTNR